MNYKIRFLILPARNIYNYVGPWDWRDTDIRKEKRRNLYEDKKEWYDNLEKDILKNGFNNPIICKNGGFGKNDLGCIPTWAQKIPVCYSLGGSRLFIGQKNNLEIPILLSDFNNTYSEIKEVYQAEDIKKFFKNPPTKIIYSSWGLDIRDLTTWGKML